MSLSQTAWAGVPLKTAKTREHEWQTGYSRGHNPRSKPTQFKQQGWVWVRSQKP